jgi:hypothetical protein
MQCLAAASSGAGLTTFRCICSILYAYTHAYYLMAAGNPVPATAVLQKLLARNPDYTEARQLLRECQKAAAGRP